MRAWRIGWEGLYMAEALYRKYRPQVFEDMVGQEHIERTLKNAIDQDKVSHAYLFCGPRGTGKTTTARLLAKALLCESGPTSAPDGTCRDCCEVAEGTHPDVYELDAASRTGVENVREEIIGRVNFAPTRGKKKVYIIDEVHMLSVAAFNALLKTLEEPPSHVVFVLCTTDPQKVPATIHSRCQRFDFHRLGTDEIVSRLGAVCMGEGVEFEGDALALIALRADGGMRNALTALEQLIAFGGGKVTVKGAEDLLGSLDSSDMAEIMRAVGNRDVAACFNWTAGYVESGADLAQFARDMAQRVRDMYVMSLAGADVALDVPDAERHEIGEELQLFGPDRLARMLALLGELIGDLRTAGNPRLCFEIALTRMVRPDSDLTLEALAERVEALEAGRSAVATSVPAANAPAAAPPQAPSAIPVSGGQNDDSAPQPLSPMAAPQQPAVPATASQQPVPTPAEPDALAPGHADVAAIVSNPAALQRTWRSVVAHVKKRNISHGVLFVNVKVRAEEGGDGVVVEFPADNPFAFAMAGKPEVQEAITEAFSQVAGVPIPFRCAQAQRKKGAAEPAPLLHDDSDRKAASSPRRPETGVPAAEPSATPQPMPRDSANQPTDASRQGMVPAQEPMGSRSMPQQPSADDEVPVDVYDDYAPGREVDRQSSDVDHSNQSSAPFAVRPAAAPQSPHEPVAPVESSESEQDGAANADDYSKMVSGSMGIDVVFEEVD